ncbi:MAG: aminoacyl-tRNA hydrolase [Parcubacteria group bacterium]|nr:aminoacyl-tRNA hydrolase [Parcubacteria group bacterium]
MKNTDFIIVGLGNPGKQYEKTPHNAGFMVLDALVQEKGEGEWKKEKMCEGLVSAVSFSCGATGLLLKPETFMNASGKSVRKVIDTPEDVEDSLIVVYDDIDMPVGSVKIVFDRGSGGHKGVRSIIDTLGTTRFTRVRVGVAPLGLFGDMKKPKGREAVSRYVLAPLSRRRSHLIEDGIRTAISAIEKIICEGREVAMNEVNTNKKNQK